MTNTVSGRLFWLTILCLLISAFSLEAQNAPARFLWSIAGSILFFPEDNGNEGDPAPLLPSFGAAAAFKIFGPLWVELSEDLYFTHYGYSTTLDRAVPAAIENRSAFVFGFITGLELQARLAITNTSTVRVYGGPAADFRAVTLAAGLHPNDLSGNPDTDAQIQTDAVREYFWSNNRWFMPVFGAGMDFAVNEKFMAGFDARVWFPTWRLGSDEDLPPIEGWRFGLGLRITPR